MALVWRRDSGGKRYEVRRAGATLRLYTNGVFHSQYNKHHLGKGSLWDMLAMPSLLLAPDQRGRALVLGVGGGAAIRYLQAYRCWTKLLGIDLDKVHLQLAREVFLLNEDNIDLQHYEAQAWLAQYRGERFDFILDDLFGEECDDHGLPLRAVTVTLSWLKALELKLSENGVLVFNIESPANAKALRREVQQAGLFQTVIELTQVRYENVIQVYSHSTLRHADTKAAFCLGGTTKGVKAKIFTLRA